MSDAHYPLENGLPQGLPWNGTVGLLLDGVSVENLAQRLYQWGESPVFEPLYHGTRWADLMDISPCLVQINTQGDPVLAQFLSASREEWGYLLFSDHTWEHMIAHLRWLTSVGHPLGEEVLLRIADPAVTHALLTYAESIKDPSLFGPCTHIVTADTALECWHQNLRPGDAPKTDHGKRYRLNAEQISRLDQVNFRNVVMRLDQHMHTHFPHYQAHAAPQQRREHLQALASASYDRGFNSELDITLYANIHGFLGEQALVEHPDLNALLETPSARTLTQRIEHIAHVASQRAEHLQRNIV